MTRVLVVLAAAVLAHGFAQEQAPPAAAGAGRLSGVVRSNGLAIPGATVTAAKGDQRAVTTTDEAGRFEFENLAPGAWTLEAAMSGFAPARRELQLDEKAATGDLELALLPPATARAPAQTGARGGFRSANLNQLAATQDTLAGAQAQAPAADPTSANEAFLMNGTLSSGLAQPIPLDEVRRFGMDPGGMAAQQAFGQGQGQASPGGPGGGGPGSMGPGGGGPGGPGGGFGGGMGPMMGGGMGPGGMRRAGRAGFDRGANFGNRIRRGRDQIRGMAFFGLDNSALDARPYSFTAAQPDKASYAQSRFGFSLGGALNIPKLVHSSRTFFFLNYTGTRSRQPYTGVGTVPTVLEREGDFSQSVSNGPVLVYDPDTNAPFPGNKVPASRINPVARGLLSYIPLPNVTGGVQNYQYVTSTSNNGDNFAVRLNHSLSDKDSFDFNVNLQRRNSTSAQLFGFTDTGDGLGTNVAFGWTHHLSATTINALRFTFSRNRNEVVPYFAYKADVAAELGIHGVSSDPINYGPPNLSFTNFGALTDASASLQRNQTSRVTDNVTLVRGPHTVTFGADYRRMQLNTRADQNARGTYTFSGLATSQINAGGQAVAGTGFDMADLLLGLPQASTISYGISSLYFRAPAYGAFVQDDWRARSNLSLTLGLRYEYFAPYQEKYDHISNLDIAPGYTGVAVVTPGAAGPYSGTFPGGLIDPDKKLFSPRAGIAWRPFPAHQFQIRAGYGVYYNGSIYNQFPSRLSGQPPYANTLSLVTSTDNPLTIADGFTGTPTETITNTYAVARDYRPAYAQTWNVTIQTELTQSWVLQVGYLGTKGTRLDVERMPNRAPAGSQLTAEQRRLIANASGFTLDTSDGNSIYHAGQVRLMRRFSRGLSLNALYTYSKSIDDASSLGGGLAVVAQNDLDLAAERGLSSFDQRHTLNLFYMLTSPVGGPTGTLQGSRLATALLKNWHLSGGLTVSSGQPFTARVLGNQSNTAGTGAVGSGRADATGEPVTSGSGYFNLAAFEVPAAGTFGNAARNTIPGIARYSLNFALGRIIELGERRNLEIRAESQNLLNHVNITGLGTVVNASNYGLATSAQGMRTITLSTRFRF
ncbi:MAG TPA: TonB-dependent receptor [Bryobacteraceae bacterium]|nr:TonB-dependent receptor [Bryobacteraceae bacterium]